MEYIDFSLLKTQTDEDNNKDSNVSKCDKHYKSLVSDQLKNDNKPDFCCLRNQGDTCGCAAEEDSRKIIEVHCEGLISEGFCEIPEGYEGDLPQEGDLILIQLDDCSDIAIVQDVSEFVKIKRSKLGLANETLPVITRLPNEADLNRYRKNLEIEMNATPTFKSKIDKYKLEMKLVNVHFQFDRKKIFFFYTADGRVDFRELARDLAGEFKTRIELRQIGVRDEAKKIGGLGTCGREYCCASFLPNFKRITTQLANDQNLTSNMSKLSGPCGKLKCCLSFEVEQEENDN